MSTKPLTPEDRERTIRILHNLASAMERGDIEVDFQEADMADGLLGDMKITMVLRGKSGLSPAFAFLKTEDAGRKAL